MKLCDERTLSHRSNRSGCNTRTAFIQHQYGIGRFRQIRLNENKNTKNVYVHDSYEMKNKEY